MNLYQEMRKERGGTGEARPGQIVLSASCPSNGVSCHCTASTPRDAYRCENTDYREGGYLFFQLISSHQIGGTIRET
jgi:hypothetical protein